jgi:hypothetical protein
MSLGIVVLVLAAAALLWELVDPSTSTLARLRAAAR